MRFQLKFFWPIIPYTFVAINLITTGTTSVYTYILWLYCLSLSILKADLFERPLSKWIKYGVFTVEVLSLIVLGERLALPFTLLAGIPILSIYWLKSPQEDNMRFHLLAWLILGVAFFPLTKSPWGIPIPFFSCWIGNTLYVLELKKKNAQLYYDQLRHSEEELLKANEALSQYYETLEEVTQLRERTRISRDIHDNVGHALSTTLIQLQAIEMRLEKSGSEEASFVTRLIVFISDALENTRKIVHDMGADAENKKAFKHEIAELCHRFSTLTGCKVLLTTTQDFPKFVPKQAEIIFRVIQESLTNAVKHGNATEVKIILSEEADQIMVTIKDNGNSNSQFKEGFGLTQMRQRIQELQGSITFTADETHGFQTQIILPKEAKHEITIGR